LIYQIFNFGYGGRVPIFLYCGHATFKAFHGGGACMKWCVSNGYRKPNFFLDCGLPHSSAMDKLICDGLAVVCDDFGGRILLVENCTAFIASSSDLRMLVSLKNFTTVVPLRKTRFLLPAISSMPEGI